MSFVDTRVVELGEGDLDIELAVAEAGGGGRPFLLLHGFTGAKEDFTDWLDPLAAEGWHVVAPDLRGHGASSKPDREDDYSLDILAGDVLALADALGWPYFALLGHSMGGYVAQRVVVAAAERVEALVLMDTSHRAVSSIDPALLAASIEIVRQQGIGVLADVMAGLDDPLATPAHRRLLAERAGYAEFGDRKLRAAAPQLFAALADELSRADDQLPALAGLHPVPPTLVVVGEQDAPFLEPSKQLAAAIPGATLAVIADAGHSPQFENPDRWWAALSSFLASLPAGRAAGAG